MPKKHSISDVAPSEMPKSCLNSYKKIIRNLEKSRTQVPEDSCIFCFRKTSSDENGHLIYHKQSGFRLHYFCLLFACGLEQSSPDCDSLDDPDAIHGFLLDDILKEFARGSKLRCNYCNHMGATVGCAVEKCKRKFHFMCGKERAALFQYTDCFTSYCVSHRPNQSHLLHELEGKDDDGVDLTIKSCCICLEEFEKSIDINEVLLLPCCTDTWLHRTCVQKQALSCGCYFFRCPTCNNKDIFYEEMLRMGIYIPTRDALWETPGAYSDLMQQQNRCDIAICKCRKGRTYSRPRTNYEILLCESCGSYGAHVACVDGIIARPFKCDICLQVDNGKEKGKNLSSNDDDSESQVFEDSDSENKVKDQRRLKRKIKGREERDTRKPLSCTANRRRSKRLRLRKSTGTSDS